MRAETPWMVSLPVVACGGHRVAHEFRVRAVSGARQYCAWAGWLREREGEGREGGRERERQRQKEPGRPGRDVNDPHPTDGSELRLLDRAFDDDRVDPS